MRDQKSKRNFRQKPLYRKVNTRARGVFHGGGGDYKHARNTKQEKQNQSTRGSMGGKQQNGLDYTPLFRFLLSKVGQDWTKVHSEAIARLDHEDPIFWIVARKDTEKRPVVGISENSYYNGLYIDENNKLALVDPEVRNEDLEPDCPCCTHTFNGIPLVRKFQRY